MHVTGNGDGVMRYVPVLLPASLPACLPVGRQVWRHVCEGDDGRLRILGWREMSGEGCAVRH